MQPPNTIVSSAWEDRIASVDQCRGFCIVMMIGGNLAGHFAFMPWILTHHKTGLTIPEFFAPVFLLMVGFGYRLSFLRRMNEKGLSEARWAAVHRYVLITLLGFLVYIDHLWDALTHIGMAGLLILPFINRSARTRILAAAGYAAVFQAIYLYTEYSSWMLDRTNSLNGGPLAAMSWGFAVLFGTVAYDLWATRDRRWITTSMLTLGAVLIVAGWLAHLPWPGVKEAWPFTRWGMSLPYPLLTTGVAFLIYLFFYWFCDVLGGRMPLASPIGANPLLMYGIMGAFIGISKLLIALYGEPDFWLSLGSWIAISLFCYGIARILYARQVSIRIS